MMDLRESPNPRTDDVLACEMLVNYFERASESYLDHGRPLYYPSWTEGLRPSDHRTLCRVLDGCRRFVRTGLAQAHERLFRGHVYTRRDFRDTEEDSMCLKSILVCAALDMRHWYGQPVYPDVQEKIRTYAAESRETKDRIVDEMYARVQRRAWINATMYLGKPPDDCTITGTVYFNEVYAVMESVCANREFPELIYYLCNTV